MGCDGEPGRGEVRLLIDSRGAVPVLPTGFCVTVKSPRGGGEPVILLRFIVTEQDVDIPVATIALTKEAATGPYLYTR